MVTLLVLNSGSVAAQEEIMGLGFGHPPVSDSDTTRTLQSLVKVQGTGGLCQDGLYLLTHFGGREKLFQEENRKLMEHPLVNRTWRYCSVFSTTTENAVIMGRNWDNQNVGSIIISYYHPSGGHASISFSRAIDLGFPLNLDLEQIRSSPLGTKLLLAPFYAMDGINEHGLAVAITGLDQTTLKPKAGSQRLFITFLVRKILDQTKSIGEAVDLVEAYTPFDLDSSSLHAHLFIVDSSGRSVILEYDQAEWRSTYGVKSWQVLTTTRIYDVSDADLRNKCWRYRTLSAALENTRADVDWEAGMSILQDVAQKGTTWSAVYSPSTREVHFSVYQAWSTIYHLSVH
jgi:hypothetical protein